MNEEEIIKKKTLNDLLRMLKLDRANNWISVGYRESRSVLDNLDSDVLAYGIGTGNFVAIYKNKVNKIKGVSFSQLQYLHTIKDRNQFKSLDPIEIIRIIKEEPLLAETFLENEKEVLENVKKYNRPIVGIIKVIIPNYNGSFIKDYKYKEYEFVVSRFKNGNYHFLRKNWYGESGINEFEFHSLIVQKFLTEDRKPKTMSKEQYDSLTDDDLEKLKHNHNIIVLENTLPDEVFSKVKNAVLLRKI